MGEGADNTVVVVNQRQMVDLVPLQPVSSRQEIRDLIDVSRCNLRRNNRRQGNIRGVAMGDKRPQQILLGNQTNEPVGSFGYQNVAAGSSLHLKQGRFDGGLWGRNGGLTVNGLL